MCALISDRKSFLQQISTEKEDEELTLKHYESELTSNLSLCVFHYSCDKATSSFHHNSIMAEDLDTFRIRNKCRKLDQKCGHYGTTPAFPQEESRSHLQKSKTLTDSFRRGFKRDPALFHQLKDHLQYDQCHSRVRATARAQNVDNTLDVEYSTSKEDNVELFEDQKKFVCSVFERDLLTDQGNAIDRHHEDDYGTQVF